MIQDITASYRSSIVHNVLTNPASIEGVARNRPALPFSRGRQQKLKQVTCIAMAAAKFSRFLLKHSDNRVKRRRMTAGTKEDVFTLAEGDVVLQWPSQISKESVQDFEDWIGLIVRKVKRAAGAEENRDDDSE